MSYQREYEEWANEIPNPEPDSVSGGVWRGEQRPHSFKPMHGQDVCWHCDGHEDDPIHDRRPNYWAEQEANGDIELPRCIHGEPSNVFCEKCEA